MTSRVINVFRFSENFLRMNKQSYRRQTATKRKNTILQLANILEKIGD